MKNRMKLLRWTVAPALVLAPAAMLTGIFALQDPPAAEARRWHLDCPESIVEGERDTLRGRFHSDDKLSPFRIHWDTHQGTARNSDYNQFNIYKWSSAHEARVGRMRKSIWTIEDDLIEGDEQFDVSGGDIRCTITIIDDDFPEVTDVAIVSTPRDGTAYRSGERINIDVTFDHPVRVPSEYRPFVHITLRLGPEGDPGDPDWGDALVDTPDGRYARYRSGTGSDTLRFSYVVREGDEDPNGISIVTSNETGLGRDMIKTVGEGLEDINALHNFPGQSNVAPHKVSAPLETPIVESVSIVSDPGEDGVYTSGNYIRVKVRFNEVVYVDWPRQSPPYIDLDFDGVIKRAEIVRSVGPGVLLFEYRVRAGDSDADGIAIPVNSISRNGGSIADPDSNQANLSHDALDPDPGHRVESQGGI